MSPELNRIHAGRARPQPSGHALSPLSALPFPALEGQALTNNTTNTSASIPLKDKSTGMGQGRLNIKEAASRAMAPIVIFPQVSLVGLTPTITHPALGSAGLAAATHKGAIFPQEWGNSLQLHPKS